MNNKTIVLESTHKQEVADFIRMALFNEFNGFRDMVKDCDGVYDDEDSAYFMRDTYRLLNLLHKIDVTGTDDNIVPEEFDDTNIEVTLEEAICYTDLVEMELCDIIRKDDEIDNPKWLYGILSFYKVCDDLVEADRAEKNKSNDTE